MRNKVILLVEDNQDDVDLTLHALEKQRVMNHGVIARDGPEALELLLKDLLDSYHSGANSYVRKPVEFERFVEAIRQLGHCRLILNQPLPKH